MKAFILAAGQGTRLRPLTLLQAKAVMPLLNVPLLFYNLNFLKNQGIKDIIINLHHLPDSIKNALSDYKNVSVNIELSHEPAILGTAGALNKVKSSLEGDTFIVMNGDTLIDIDLDNALKFHRDKGALATMIVKPFPSDSSYSPVFLDDQCRIIGIKGKPPAVNRKLEKWLFSGVQILQPEVFNYIPSQGSSQIIKDFYLPALENQEPIFGFKTAGFWQEIGAPKSYIEANKKLLTIGSEGIAEKWGIECNIRSLPKSAAQSSFPISKMVIDESVEIKQRVKIEDWAIIARGVQVGRDCTIKSSILFPHCILGEQSCISNSILLPGVNLAPRSEIIDSILLPEVYGFHPSNYNQKVDANYLLPL